MGPRLVSRGRQQAPRPGPAHGQPSMGPRLVSRGRTFEGADQSRLRDPSMGPRLVSRGRQAKRIPSALSGRLQWGRDWLAAGGAPVKVDADNLVSTFNGAATG